MTAENRAAAAEGYAQRGLSNDQVLAIWARACKASAAVNEAVRLQHAVPVVRAILAASQPQPKASARTSGGPYGSNVNPDAPTVRPPVPPAAVSHPQPKGTKLERLSITLDTSGLAAELAQYRREAEQMAQAPAPGPVLIGGEDTEVIRQKLRTLDATMGGDGESVLSEVIDAAIACVQHQRATQAPAVAPTDALDTANRMDCLAERLSGSVDTYLDVRKAGDTIRELVAALASKPPVQHKEAQR